MNGVAAYCRQKKTAGWEYGLRVVATTGNYSTAKKYHCDDREGDETQTLSRRYDGSIEPAAQRARSHGGHSARFDTSRLEP